MPESRKLLILSHVISVKRMFQLVQTIAESVDQLTTIYVQSKCGFGGGAMNVTHRKCIQNLDKFRSLIKEMEIDANCTFMNILDVMVFCFLQFFLYLYFQYC